MIEIRYATDKDINFVASNLRAVDLSELNQSYSGTAYEAVTKSAAASIWCKVALVDGLPCVLYGVVPSIAKGVGVPWLVATDDMNRIPKRFILKNCVSDIQEMESSFSYLYNFIHPGNRIAINWLRWLGFEVTNITNEKGFLLFQKEVRHV